MATGGQTVATVAVFIFIFVPPLNAAASAEGTARGLGLKAESRGKSAFCVHEHGGEDV